MESSFDELDACRFLGASGFGMSIVIAQNYIKYNSVFFKGLIIYILDE